MYVCASQGKFNQQRCINSITSGVLGRQEEVRATTARLERGSSESFLQQQRLSNKKHIDYIQLTEKHHRDWISVYHRCGFCKLCHRLVVTTVSADSPTACVCEKSYLNVDDTAGAFSPISHFHPFSIPPFSGSAILSLLLQLQWNRRYLTDRDGCWKNAQKTSTITFQSKTPKYSKSAADISTQTQRRL